MTTIELTTETLGFATLIISVISGVVAYCFKRKDRYIDKLEKEIADARLRMDALQDRELQSLRAQLTTERDTAGAHNWLAKALDEQTELIKKLSDHRRR